MNEPVKLSVKLIAYTPNPEELVAAAARICYSPDDVETIMDNMTPKQVEGLINRLTNMGHESPFEHVSFTFSVSGVSRVLLAQATRHRIGATFSVRSQRYNDEAGFGYIVPAEIERLGLEDMFIEAVEKIQKSYEKIFMAMMFEYLWNEHANNIDAISEKFIDKAEKDAVKAMNFIKNKHPKIWTKYEKLAAENARYICPGATETKFALTMNARELLHFFELRCCNRAQEEIRDMATAMLREVLKVSPKLFRLAGPGCVNGVCPESSMGCGKAAEMRKKFKEMKEGTENELLD